jgi:hypothetical protein
VSLFPADDKARKSIPVWKYLTRYFPKAHREVTKVCVVNNVRYSPDREPTDIHWARGKSPDQLGSALRHMLESAVDGKVFEEVPAEVAKVTGIERVYVLAEAMWRLGAELELAIEREEALQELSDMGQEMELNEPEIVLNEDKHLGYKVTCRTCRKVDYLLEPFYGIYYCSHACT